MAAAHPICDQAIAQAAPISPIRMRILCSTPHGGNESTLIFRYNPMAHLGLIIVPLGYTDPALFKAGTPYGASSVLSNKSEPPTGDDLDVARFQGRRVAQVARALKAAGVTTTKE